MIVVRCYFDMTLVVAMREGVNSWWICFDVIVNVMLLGGWLIE